MKLFLSCLLISLSLATIAQDIKNLNASFTNGAVVITYDLTGDNPKQKYNIRLYSSHNDYLNSLSFVTGDVGENVAGGIQKQIIWSVAKELGTFKGELSFKLKAEVLPFPLLFTSHVEGSSVRRGKSTSVQWEGGVKGQNVKLEVYQGSERVATMDTKNAGQYDWSVPASLQKGGGYLLRLTEGSQTVTSAPFVVKAKIPLLLKLSPLIIGAAIIPFLGGGGGSEPTPPASEQLAAAPNPN